MLKAYDKVEWPFPTSVLQQMGFPLDWVNLIMDYVSTVNFFNYAEWYPQESFVPQRGFRQGDPLSRYLFILCGEVFSALINKAILASSLHGIKGTKNAPMISHLLFSKNSVIFSQTTVQEAMSIKTILATYEQASDQVINLNKSMLSCNRNVPDSCFHELKQLLNVKAVECYDKYLGLPTIIGKSKIQIFNFVKDRVWKKLKGWKEKFLSRDGRETLVKAVAQAISSYVMSCFLLSNGICSHIEGMIRRFYWGGDVTKRGMHWLSWIPIF
ncbi:uncharacterized protein LOC130719658 [Lotus japonicus]|uniref:uncharacterized protein LOC130719658 n=1 Tax=Lotus japonicus TaxID=34305 RepID=UPI00258E3EA0|nr:uncharacterized protein LOC130719658 [Lotus japonicus]